MNNLDAWLQRTLEADDRLAAWYAAMDREFERLKQEHNARAGNPYGFTAHIAEMSRQAMACVKDDPKQATFEFLDELADVFLKLPQADRDALSGFFVDCRHLERIHRGYISAHAAERLRVIRDVTWLWRGLVIAALAQGGKDFRDLHISLGDLWDAARSAGHSPTLAFKQIASFASTKPGRGGLNSSIREFLASYRR